MRHFIIITLAALVGVGCQGVIEDAPLERTAGPRPTTDPGVLSPDAVGPMPLRFLTPGEYDRTLRSLVRTELSPGTNLPPAASGDSGYGEAGRISELHVTGFMESAERVAVEVAVPIREQYRAELGCDPITECPESFVEQFGRRAFRRPLSADENSAYVALFADESAIEGGESAFGFLIGAILQSPYFLYHWERRPNSEEVGEDAMPLDGFQRASRLSYFLTGTMPDDALLDAAAAGELDETAGVEAHAHRLLDLPDAQDSVVRFAERWLHMEDLLDKPKNTTVYPEFDGAMRRSVIGEMETFVREHVFSEDGTFESLLSSPVTYVDTRLASFYGLEPVTSEGFERREHTEQPRPGLLTRAAFLASSADALEGNPIFRGVVIREQVLCERLPSPPANIPPLPAATEEAPTLRERVAQHTAGAVCQTCHRLINGAGFAFLQFDAVGAYEPVQDGMLVDATGNLELLEDRSYRESFDDVEGFVSLLLSRPESRRCFVEQWLRNALRRGLDRDDEPSRDAIEDAFAGDELNVQDLLVAVATSRSFLFHRAEGINP